MSSPWRTRNPRSTITSVAPAGATTRLSRASGVAIEVEVTAAATLEVDPPGVRHSKKHELTKQTRRASGKPEISSVNFASSSATRGRSLRHRKTDQNLDAIPYCYLYPQFHRISRRSCMPCSPRLCHSSIHRGATRSHSIILHTDAAQVTLRDLNPYVAACSCRKTYQLFLRICENMAVSTAGETRSSTSLRSTSPAPTAATLSTYQRSAATSPRRKQGGRRSSDRLVPVETRRQLL